MRISIIIPTRNEGGCIRGLLSDLRRRAAAAELIVVDGQSSDDTVTKTTDCCDQLLLAPPHRAIQMNAGAADATGDVLWFLHADARIPDHAIQQIAGSLNDPEVVGGYFRIRLPDRSLVYRLTDFFAHYAGIALRMRCGDHGFFCRRETFRQIGGFPEVELMEDVDFFRRLRGVGRVVVIPDRIVVSARRYEAVGRWRLSLAFGLIALLYLARVPRSVLQKIYRRTCCADVACRGDRSASY